MTAPPNTPPRDRRLTDRQLRFAEEFAARGNRVQAFFAAYGREYINKAGKTVPRSYQAAATSARKLLENPRIRDEVDAALKAQLGRTRISSDRWVRKLVTIAFGDVCDLFESDPENGGLPRPRPLADLPPAGRSIVKGIRVKRRRLSGGGDTATEVEEIEFKAHDALKAMELLGRHFGFFAERQPLDQLLALIPPKAADVIRRALAEAMEQGTSPRPG